MPLKAVNVAGQASSFLTMTPVKRGEEGELRDYLEGLRDRGKSPLSRVPRTHMARWLIVSGFHSDRSYRQRKPETLAIPSLLFSSVFDGDRDSYLDELCEALAPEAPDIWGRCIGCPTETDSAGLKAYLKHNQIDCGYFYAAYGNATVGRVRASLDQRDRLIAFATRAQCMQPADCQQAFVEEFVR